jgi:DNA adenine methylase
LQDTHETTASAGSRKRIAAFPYRGGKYHLAPKLVKLLPPHKIYVEVFGGAGNVLLTKPASQIEVYNDRDGALVNLFETLRNHPLLFLERCRGLLYSRQLFNAWSRQLDTQFKGVDIDRVEAAVRTAYAITSSFTGDPTKGWAFDRSGSGGGCNRWASIWDKVAYVSERLRRVNIDCLDFRECIRNWDTERTLFFLDPPYLSTVSPGFYDFAWQDHVDLAGIVRKITGQFLLTYDDNADLRDLYKGFDIQKVSAMLASQKVKPGAKRVPLRQIIVSNFPIGENKIVSDT